MATWVTHFRIAEELINLGLPVSKEEFLVGNIAPDCGMPAKEGRGFKPGKEITHFTIDKKTNANLFYEQYLANREVHISNKRDSFYLGYYAHLITDEEWSKFQREKQKEPIHQEMSGTTEYKILKKKERYGLDFLYLRNNIEHIFWTTFQHIKEFPDYIDIYEQGQLTERVKQITNFYLNNTISEEYEFRYLSMKEVDKFVEETTGIIKNRINELFITNH